MYFSQTVRERGVVMLQTHFKFLRPHPSHKWLELLNSVCRDTISSLAKGMINHFQKGLGYGHVTHLNF